MRIDRESTLAEWDDLDNRLQHEQDGRDHHRRLDRAKREDDLEDIEYRRRARKRQEEQEEQKHRIAMQKLTTALDPSKAPTENNAVAQFRALMKDVHALHEAGREEIDKLKSRTDLSAVERDEGVFKVRAAMTQFAQHIASTGELPDDMRRQVMDAFNRA